MEIIKRVGMSDLFVLFGFGLTGYGLYLISPLLVPLILGSVMLITGLIGTYIKGADR